MRYHVFGIRHHGPGCARALRSVLESLKPDLILIEGPPDANELLSLVSSPAMTPPVALLVYAIDQPKNAVFYPFADFSPEWNAIKIAQQHDIPVKFFDLPIQHSLALEARPIAIASTPQTDPIPDKKDETGPAHEQPLTQLPNDEATSDEDFSLLRVMTDPLGELARLAGYDDHETWWEEVIEHRYDSTQLFEAINEAVSAVRTRQEELLRQLETTLRSHAKDQTLGDHPASQGVVLTARKRDVLREAWMREELRDAIKQGHERIAIVCGAWHGPAFADLKQHAKSDRELLRGLPKLKVQATWIPWSNDRLSLRSGYGAGIHSPGWYEVIWRESQHAKALPKVVVTSDFLFDVDADRAPDDPTRDTTTDPELEVDPEEVDHQAGRTSNATIRWLSLVARLIREQDLDAPPASIIEAVRMAETLSAIRNLPRPGLPELTESARAVLCHGREELLDLIRQKLEIGTRVGKVPPETPSVALRRDLEVEAKRLRLKLAPNTKRLELDLRESFDQERSQLFYRVVLLNVEWAKLLQAGTSTAGFKEVWELSWEPESESALIEANVWGNTIEQASDARTLDKAESITSLATLADLLMPALRADLPTAVDAIINLLRDRSALAGDVRELMESFVSLSAVERYGTNEVTMRITRNRLASVTPALDVLFTRATAGLANACKQIDDESAQTLSALVATFCQAVVRRDQAEALEQLLAVMRTLAELPSVHARLRGLSARFLIDQHQVDDAELERLAYQNLTDPSDSTQAAHWLAGLFQGGGSAIMLLEPLWRVLDRWLCELSGERFMELLPILRRAFSEFKNSERQGMAKLIVRMNQPRDPNALETNADSADAWWNELDQDRARLAIPVLKQILGEKRLVESS